MLKLFLYKVICKVLCSNAVMSDSQRLSLCKVLCSNAVMSDSQRLSLLKNMADILFDDFRLTWHQLDWWHHTDFNKFLKMFDEIQGFNCHRKWMLWQLLRLTASVTGDTAECGVFKGASSWLICTANHSSSIERTHHLFDSFEGVSEPSELDGSHWRKGDLAAGEDVVSKNLSPFLSQIEFHKGWIPERFVDVKDMKFSFVHVDVDLYEPTRDSIEFFYDRISPGGILLCDDYAFNSCPGATKAVDTFLDNKPEKMIRLDAGGGFSSKIV
jgi:hypothetical protein